MGTVRVDEHIREMEQFLEASKHLGTVLHNFENLGTVDKNDLYDLVYRKRTIETWLDDGVTNEDIKHNLEQMLKSINILLDSISDDNLNKIINHNKKGIGKLNLAKYNNKQEFKGLRDAKEIKIKEKNIVQGYLARNASKIILAFALMLLVSNGTLFNVAKNTASIVMNNIDKVLEIESETEEDNVQIENSIQDSEKTLVDVVVNEAPKPDEEKLKEHTGMVDSSLVILIMVVTTMLIFTTMFGMCIDLAYIMLPIVRAMGVFDRIVSSDAKKLLELHSMEGNMISTEKVVDYTDRFETSTALLHNTELYMEHIKSRNSYNTDLKALKDINNSLKVIEGALESIKGRIKKKNVREKVEALVDAELLYNKYKNSIDAYLAERRLLQGE